jgi:hypothetical protein
VKVSGFAALALSTAPQRDALVRHPVYATLDGVGALRALMQAHVFAVWDFMTLLKTLQQRLTCVRTPWLPPADREAARLINEIVLGEETDEIGPGEHASHFEIYVDAMREVGADVAPIGAFCAALAAGASPDAALDACGAPPGAAAFVRATLASCERPTHEVAAAFVLGREQLVPAMFERALAALDAAGLAAPRLRWYLARHVALDGDDHGPKAARLLEVLCGDDPVRWAEAEAAAGGALTARRALWDAVAAAMRPVAAHAAA